jgi:hypothetical protein
LALWTLGRRARAAGDRVVDGHDARDYVVRSGDRDARPDIEADLPDVAPVVEAGTPHRRPEKVDGAHLCDRRYSALAADLRDESCRRRRSSDRCEFEGDRSTGPTVQVTEGALVGEVVQAHHQAVDLVRQLVA